MLGRLVTLRHPLLRPGLRIARPCKNAPLRGVSVSANVQAESAASLIRGGEFVKKLAVELDCNETAARKYLATVLRIIEEEVCAGNKVSFQSFGNFHPKHRPARKARNPRTQEVLEVPPQTVPQFTASKMFKDKVNQLAPSKVEEVEEEQ